MGILRERNVENLLKDIVFQYINITISFMAYFAFLKRIKSSVGRVTVMCSRIKKSCRRRRILFTAPRPPHYYTEKLSSFPFIEFRHFCLARCTFCRPTASSKKDAVVVILNKNISRPLPKLHISKFLFVFEVFFGWCLLVCKGFLFVWSVW